MEKGFKRGRFWSVLCFVCRDGGAFVGTCVRYVGVDHSIHGQANKRDESSPVCQPGEQVSELRSNLSSASTTAGAHLGHTITAWQAEVERREPGRHALVGCGKEGPSTGVQVLGKARRAPAESLGTNVDVAK